MNVCMLAKAEAFEQGSFISAASISTCRGRLAADRPTERHRGRRNLRQSPRGYCAQLPPPLRRAPPCPLQPQPAKPAVLVRPHFRARYHAPSPKNATPWSVMCRTDWERGVGALCVRGFVSLHANAHLELLVGAPSAHLGPVSPNLGVGFTIRSGSPPAARSHQMLVLLLLHI